MDPLDLLIADHNRVRGIFARYQDAQDAGDTARQAALAREMFEELAVHTTIEEEIFYPWARSVAAELGEVIDEGLEEHHVAKTLIAEAEGLDVGSREWNAKIAVLIESVEHHAGEEESDLFPKLRHGPAADRAGVGDDLAARKVALGAPPLSRTLDLTTEELRRKATEQAIPGRSTMDHDELAATVKP